MRLLQCFFSLLIMCWHRYDDADSLVLRLHIQTGAKRTEVIGLHGDALKLKLAATPVEGKANAVLLKFIAQCFEVPLSQVMLKQGEKSRRKLIVVQQSNHGPSALFNGVSSLSI